MTDHPGVGAPERERLTDRQQLARSLNENREEVVPGLPDSPQLLPGSISPRRACSDEETY